MYTRPLHTNLLTKSPHPDPVSVSTFTSAKTWHQVPPSSASLFFCIFKIFIYRNYILCNSLSIPLLYIFASFTICWYGLSSLCKFCLWWHHVHFSYFLIISIHILSIVPSWYDIAFFAIFFIFSGSWAFGYVSLCLCRFHSCYALSWSIIL